MSKHQIEQELILQEKCLAKGLAEILNKPLCHKPDKRLEFS